ncbi:major facilitator superfamily transporter [Cercophora samala]|uniref:Major facilitator superfamily transporter n=1 Tax=Cercophora samala TaxID=330535 RepID=A0AA40D3Z8_9PEZI|nr:major facilitator superfamily transporter [Cercophora samala]
MHRSDIENPSENSESIPRWSFGVLNPKDTVDVPGSVQLLASPSPQPSTPPPDDNESPPNSQKTTPDGRVILSPQPSPSPHDPLNWPPWRRDAALTVLGLYSLLGGGITPLLAAGFREISHDYNVPLSSVALTTGLIMLGLGVGCVIASPTAILYGKRPVYLTSAVMFLLTSVWCALSPNFTSLLVARVVQGVAVSPVEALPSATITELFFLHERGVRIGVYGFCLLGGKNLVPVVGAGVIHRWGWRWAFWVMGGCVGVVGGGLWLFGAETFWDRGVDVMGEKRVEDRGLRGQGSLRHDGMGEISTPDNDTGRRSGETVELVETVNDPITSSSSAAWSSSSETRGNQDLEKRIVEHPGTPPRRNEYTSRMAARPAGSFSRHLLPWHGRLRQDENWFRVAARPFFLFAYPAILWSAIVYSCCIGWLVVISESMDVIYRDPNTYHFSAFSTGLVYISPFIGGVLGTAIAGKMSDVIVKAMARRNGGVFEPEFRLVMIIPVAITTVIGLMGFGWSAEVHDAWIVPTVFFGIISFGCSLGSTTAITFCVDSYRQFAGEALVTLNFSKNIFHGLVFSLFVTGWIQTDGPKIVYIWIGVIQLVAMLFTVPLFLFGKRARHWTSKQGFHKRITSTD